jgi:hypothetical protein
MVTMRLLLINPRFPESWFSLKFRQTGAPDLAVCLKDRLDGPFFKRAAPDLERLLKHTRASVTLRVDAFQAHELGHF